jgi:hypothetical protein
MELVQTLSEEIRDKVEMERGGVALYGVSFVNQIMSRGQTC